MMVPRFTSKELKRLDQQSTENMLCFYEEELRRAANGEQLTSFIGKPLIKRFIDLGILERVWDKKRRRIILSQKGREWYNLHSS
jgi:hypothetical protein